MEYGRNRDTKSINKTNKIRPIGRSGAFVSLATYVSLAIKNEWFCYLLTLNRFSV